MTTRTKPCGIHRPITAEEKATIIRMANEGKTRREIADALPHRNYYSITTYMRKLFLNCEIDRMPEKTNQGKRVEINPISNEAREYKIQESLQ